MDNPTPASSTECEKDAGISMKLCTFTFTFILSLATLFTYFCHTVLTFLMLNLTALQVERKRKGDFNVGDVNAGGKNQLAFHKYVFKLSYYLHIVWKPS